MLSEVLSDQQIERLKMMLFTDRWLTTRRLILWKSPLFNAKRGDPIISSVVNHVWKNGLQSMDALEKIAQSYMTLINYSCKNNEQAAAASPRPAAAAASPLLLAADLRATRLLQDCEAAAKRGPPCVRAAGRSQSVVSLNFTGFWECAERKRMHSGALTGEAGSSKKRSKQSVNLDVDFLLQGT